VPILDIELVHADGDALPAASVTQALADAAGRVLGSAPGRAWVRVRALGACQYGENGTTVAPGELPVFVTVLHAHAPQGEALAAEVLALTQAVAACLGRAPGQVHVQYAPSGAGRQAFGGTLVT
jgi:phenylpyruvate tautomerase PptA (4-oxalocrotonate tautomerase family)